MTITQRIAASFPALARLHASANGDSRLRFNNLMHPIIEELLARAYGALNRKAAKGIDGESWRSYGANLKSKLEDLCRRLHQNQYRPQAVKRTWIPKSNGQQRPIGVTTLEDKIVQQALVWVWKRFTKMTF